MNKDATSRIVVVDDDPAFRDFMFDLLAEEGFEPVLWDAAAGAAGLVAETQPSLVILDIRLEAPGSGWQVLTQLKAAEPTRDIPVLVCSADNSLSSKAGSWCEQSGVWLVEKPFSVDDLLAVMSLALQARALTYSG
jgi:DNA-binding response OmpR family regulator